MHTLIIFGASGDLTSRKLIPALYQLFRKNRLPAPMKIVGMARTPYSDDEWRAQLREKSSQFLGQNFHDETWNAFAEILHYFPGDATQDADFPKLEAYLLTLERNSPLVEGWLRSSRGGSCALNRDHQPPRPDGHPSTGGEFHHPGLTATPPEEGNSTQRVYYFATSPTLYASLSEHLARTATAKTQRLVIEKPFGTDLLSAHRLNKTLHAHFREDQIFRIDHYLGKETAQNLMVLRFANTIFESLWNRDHVANVQITINEETLVGHRAGYYEKSGVLRDMFQNHLLQLLCLIALEPPARFEADTIRDEKVKVLRSVRKLETRDEILQNTIRGQYAGYLTTENVAPGSRVPTFAGVRLMIDNWRWSGVPFYLRSGKGMSCRSTQIIIHFHRPPHALFENAAGGSRFQENRLLIQIQPAEGIQIHFQTKVPDTDMKIRQTEFQFDFSQSFQGEMPEAYERLILDALQGDASLFARGDEVENAWKIIDPIQRVWDEETTPAPFPYEIGTWGPEESNDWIQSFGQEWFDACPRIK